MDLYIDTTVEEVEKVFRRAGFEVRRCRKCQHAVQWNGSGRLHAEFVALGHRVYCDFHFDHPLHFLFLGVDYRRRPRQFFQDRLRDLFARQAIPVEARDVTWLTRRNRAVFRGFRL